MVIHVALACDASKNSEIALLLLSAFFECDCIQGNGFFVNCTPDFNWFFRFLLRICSV